MHDEPDAPEQASEWPDGPHEKEHIHFVTAAPPLHFTKSSTKINAADIVFHTISNRCIEGEIEVGECLAIQGVLLNSDQWTGGYAVGDEEQRTAEQPRPVVCPCHSHYGARRMVRRQSSDKLWTDLDCSAGMFPVCLIEQPVDIYRFRAEIPQPQDFHALLFRRHGLAADLVRKIFAAAGE